MRQIEFLYELKRELRTLPEDLVLDLLTDYEEHFQHGKENGKTEETICEELGSPKDVAEEYLYQYRERIQDMNQESRFSDDERRSDARRENGKRSRDQERYWEGDVYYTEAGPRESHMIKEERAFPANEIEAVVVEAQLEIVSVLEDHRDDILVRIYGETVWEQVFQINRKGNTVEVKTKKAQKSFIWNKKNTFVGNIRIEVLVPQNWNRDVMVKANMGSITIDGNFHYLSAKASMGSVKVKGWHKEVDIVANMGAIRLDHFCAEGRVKSDMGSISFRAPIEQVGLVSARTSMGSVSVPKWLQTQENVRHWTEGKRHMIQFDNAPVRLEVSCSMGSVKFSKGDRE